MIDVDVWTLAKQRLHHIYDLHDRVSVSFSGGKDSTVILHATIEVARERGALPVEAFFWDEEAIEPETVDYVRRVAQWPEVRLRWLCLPVTHRNGCSLTSPFWWPWDPDCPELWVRPVPAEGITKIEGFQRHKIPAANPLLFPADGSRVAVILGLRADESLNRFRSVTHRREDNYLSPDPFASWITLTKPIYDWRTIDVWTAPHLMGWDHNRAYDVMAMAGISPSQQRVAPPFGEQPMKNLWKWQVGWPEQWDRMCQRVPGARTAALHARNELYGAQLDEQLEPPPGMTWQEAIAYYLDRHPPDVRAFTARRIRSFIRNHQQKTRRPIPIRQPDPLTGLSWAFMLRIAIRGDLKGRDDPLTRSRT